VKWKSKSIGLEWLFLLFWRHLEPYKIENLINTPEFTSVVLKNFCKSSPPKLSIEDYKLLKQTSDHVSLSLRSSCSLDKKL